MSVETIQNSRDSLGRFQEKKTPRAKRVEIWLEPQLITRVDSLCELLKVGRGRIIQRLMERLLPNENQPADHLSPGSSITRLDYQGNESNSMVLARQGHLLLTSGPEPWLEWEIIQGWNLAFRRSPLELAGPSLEDFVAIAEPALLSSGFDLEDQQISQLLNHCKTLGEDTNPPKEEEDIEVLPWPGPAQTLKGL
jgi:hypothetical protein